MRLLVLLLIASLAACSKNEAPADSSKAPVPESANETKPAMSSAEPTIDKSGANWKQTLGKPELMAFDADKTYVWTLATNKGEMRFRLFPDVAPMHVTSTVYLTKLGFYDDVIFHRVIPGFMAQGGDPTGTGGGGPGYQYQGEFVDGVIHDRPGLLSMANAGPGTDGSQFFITFVPTPWLDGKHTIFGELIEGQDVLAMFEAAGTSSGKVTEELRITKATISTD